MCSTSHIAPGVWLPHVERRPGRKQQGAERVANDQLRGARCGTGGRWRGEGRGSGRAGAGGGAATGYGPGGVSAELYR
jgi:hypothetical protein